MLHLRNKLTQNQHSPIKHHLMKTITTNGRQHTKSIHQLNPSCMKIDDFKNIKFETYLILVSIPQHNLICIFLIILLHQIDIGIGVMNLKDKENMELYNFCLLMKELC